MARVNFHYGGRPAAIADFDGLKSSLMAARVIIGIVAMLCGSVCGIMSALVSDQMVDNVNDKLVEGEQFEGLGWHLVKRQQLHREYRSIYPDGPFLFRLRALVAVAIICLLICAWSLGFFGP